MAGATCNATGRPRILLEGHGSSGHDMVGVAGPYPARVRAMSLLLQRLIYACVYGMPPAPLVVGLRTECVFDVQSGVRRPFSLYAFPDL